MHLSTNIIGQLIAIAQARPQPVSSSDTSPSFTIRPISITDPLVSGIQSVFRQTRAGSLSPHQSGGTVSCFNSGAWMKHKVRFWHRHLVQWYDVLASLFPRLNPVASRCPGMLMSTCRQRWTAFECQRENPSIRCMMLLLGVTARVLSMV